MTGVLLQAPEGDRTARLLCVARQLGDDELAVLLLVAERLAMGQRRYGAFHVASDPRSFDIEALEEAADGLVYAAAALIRAKIVTIVEAMRDPALFGPWFKDRGSWRAWEVFLAALFGLPIEGEDAAALYARYTGRSTPPTAPAREAWVVAGRRGGKSHIAALVAVYLACFRDYRQLPGPR